MQSVLPSHLAIFIGVFVAPRCTMGVFFSVNSLAKGKGVGHVVSDVRVCLRVPYIEGASLSVQLSLIFTHIHLGTNWAQSPFRQ